MAKNILFFIVVILGSSITYGQSDKAEGNLINNQEYKGVDAENTAYKAIYQLDSSDPKTIEKTIRNINNVLKDPRLEGKLKIELITFSGGTQALLKKNKQYEKPVKELVEKGVIVAQCENSLDEQGRTKDEFFDFIGYVPSGNGELIIREKQGWTIIKP